MPITRRQFIKRSGKLSLIDNVSYPTDNPLAVGLKLAVQLLTTVPEAAILYVRLASTIMRIR